MTGPARTVPQGRIRLKGHFCGVATTASHCLDVGITFNYEVPLAVVEPLLAAFLQAAREEEAADPGRTPTGSASRPLSVASTEPEDMSTLWQDLLKVCSADSNGKDSVAQEIMRMAQLSRPGRVSISGDSPLDRIEERDSAMEVDLEAKEELLKKVMREREQLLQENAEFKEREKAGVVGDLMRRATHIVQEGMHEVEHALGLEPSENHEHHGKVQFREQADEVRVREGHFLLNGQFNGHVVTSKHLLEVSMPIEGTIPGAPVVEIAKALAAENGNGGIKGGDQAAKSLDLSTSSTSFDLKVWAKLAALLSSEVPPEQLVPGGRASAELEREVQRLRAQLAQQPQPAQLPQDAQQQEELKRLRHELEQRTHELGVARVDHSKLRLEADELRSKNNALAGFLASAETNAQKLRSALSQAGLSPSHQDPHRSHTAPAAAAPPSAERAAQVEAPPLPSAPRQRTPHTEVFVGATAAEAAFTAERPPIAAPPPLMAAAHWRSSPPRSATPSNTSTPPRTSTPRRADVTPRLKLTDAALVADLQELERWAKELRSLKA